MLRKSEVPALRGKEALRTLSRPGPHRVLRGDLGLVGTPGVVFTPERGYGLPAVGFGHGWLTGVGRYRGLLEHLASWGIVVVAPNTERGPVPSHLDLAGDLLTGLDVATGLRLGVGDISVRPDRLGLVGHGMGAGAAVLAAARVDGAQRVAAVAALFPAPTAPAAETAAARITAPALVLAGDDLDTGQSNARELARGFGGETQLVQLADAAPSGIVEGRQVLAAFGVGGHERSTAKLTRALLAGFLLATLTDDPRCRAFAAGEAPALPRLTPVDPADEPEPPAPPSKFEVARALLGH